MKSSSQGEVPAAQTDDATVIRNIRWQKKTVSWREFFETPRLFLLIIVLSLIVFFIWINIAEVDRVVRTEGRIIPSAHNQQVQHLEGGIIASISVREGDVVKKGDPLLTIDATTADANLNDSNVKFITQRLRAARLKAEVTGATEPDFPLELAKTEAAEAEKKLFFSRREKLVKDRQIHQEQIRQSMAELAETESRRKNLEAEIAIAHKRTKMVESMAAKQAASQIELMDAQSRERRLETEISDAENAKPKLTAAISQVQAKLSAIQADFKSEAQKELVEALAEIDRLQQSTAAAADRVSRTEVRAPIDGIVNRIAINTVGGVVRTGDVLVEITPKTEEIVLEAKAHPKDRADLRIGLPVKVRISAYDVSELGPLSGTVTEVSADTVQEGKDEPYYRIKAVIPTVAGTPYENKIMSPGMTATGDIVTGRRTIFAYLISPFCKFTNTMFRDPK